MGNRWPSWSVVPFSTVPSIVLINILNNASPWYKYIHSWDSNVMFALKRSEMSTTKIWWMDIMTASNDNLQSLVLSISLAFYILFDQIGSNFLPYSKTCHSFFLHKKGHFSYNEITEAAMIFNAIHKSPPHVSPSWKRWVFFFSTILVQILQSVNLKRLLLIW